MPGLHTVRAYRRASLGHDLVAGLVLTTPLVPAGMGYAEAAGLPAVTDLYATIAALVAYAIIGPSRIVILGPVRERLQRFGLVERIGVDRFYRTVGEAVRAYVTTTGVAWTDWEDRL